MLLRIPSVLDRSEVDIARRMLASAPFVDGKLSAGQVAKRVKHNQEVDRHADEIEQLNNLVMGKLVQHPIYRSGALPLRVAAPYYARYTPGMQYGDHVDDPVMGTDGTLYRSDISITVFLSDPASYEGGELVIGRAARGYVALYRYLMEIDTVFLLAVRSQREVGYKRDI